MADPGDNSSAAGLTPKIGKVATRQLASHGFTTYDQLTRVSEDELLSIHGVGPRAIRILGEELKNRGKSFAT